MVKGKTEEKSGLSSEQFSLILSRSRLSFQELVAQLKNGKQLPQSLEFEVLKVEAELESLEATVKELTNPSDGPLSTQKASVLNASIGKLLPHFLVNFEKLKLQCGVPALGADLEPARALFENSPEFTDLLLAERING